MNNSRISGFCTTAQVKFPKTDLADIATCREELARVGCSPECIDAAVRRYAEHRAPPRGKTTTSSRAGGKATRPPPVIGKNPKPRAVETPRVKDEPIEIRKPSTEETHAFYAQLIAATGR